VIRRRIHTRVGWALSCMSIATLMTACAISAGQRHQLAVSSQTVASALFAVQDAETVLYSSGKLTPAQHQQFNQELVTALTLGRSFNAEVRAWQPGQPAPDVALRLKASLLKLSTELMATWKAEDRAAVQLTITLAYDAVVAVLLLRGGG